MCPPRRCERKMKCENCFCAPWTLTFASNKRFVHWLYLNDAQQENLFVCIAMIRVAMCLGCTMGIIYVGLLVQQWIQRRSLPSVNPELSAYSRCVGKFLDDLTTYSDCLDRHSSKRCLFDDNIMTNQDDAHNCLGLITNVPDLSLNAEIIKSAHDVCYIYLRSVGECMGLAVELDEFLPCFRKEVFARVALVIQKCKNESGLTGDDANNFGNPIPDSFSFQAVLYGWGRDRNDHPCWIGRDERWRGCAWSMEP